MIILLVCNSASHDEEESNLLTGISPTTAEYESIDDEYNDEVIAKRFGQVTSSFRCSNIYKCGDKIQVKQLLIRAQYNNFDNLFRCKQTKYVNLNVINDCYNMY